MGVAFFFFAGFGPLKGRDVSLPFRRERTSQNPPEDMETSNSSQDVHLLFFFGGKSGISASSPELAVWIIY